jgi:DNA-binding MarR family transcriptional regulator
MGDTYHTRSLGKLISHISRNIHWMVHHELESIGVGSGQYFFLHLVHRHPGSTQNEISREIDIDKATAAKGLAKLEQAGYLRRVPDQRDRRVRRMFLTTEGEAVIPKIEATLRKVTKVCASDLSENEVDELFRLLDKVEASLVDYIKDNA